MNNTSVYFPYNDVFVDKDSDRASVNRIMESANPGGHVVLLNKLNLSIENCSTVLNISSNCSSKLMKLIISEFNRKYLPLISTQHLIQLRSFYFLTIQNIFNIHRISPLNYSSDQYDIKFFPNKRNIVLSILFPDQVISTSVTEDVCLYLVQEISSNTTLLTVGISSKGRLYFRLKDNKADLNICFFIYKILCDWHSYRKHSNAFDSHAEEIEVHSFIPHQDMIIKEALESLHFNHNYEVDEITFRSQVAIVNEENSFKYRMLSDVISNDDNANSEINFNLFVLAGQSNMSGRGELHDTTQANRNDGPTDVDEDCHKYTTASSDIENNCVMSDGNLREPMRDKVYFFDPIHGWTLSHPLLHYNVDILRKDKVGLGPGTPFAGHYYELLQQQQQLSKMNITNPVLKDNSDVTTTEYPYSLLTTTTTTTTCNIPNSEQQQQQQQQQSSPTVIGLIPVAVGATSIDEWQPDYLPSQTTPAITTNTTPSSSSSYIYHEGCLNLMSCALRSIYLAITTIIISQSNRNSSSSSSSDDNSKKKKNVLKINISSDSLVNGILWFQGSRDATFPVHITEQYHIKLKTFIKTFRIMIQAIEILVNESTRRPSLSTAQVDDKFNFLTLSTTMSRSVIISKDMDIDSPTSNKEDEGGDEIVLEEAATPAVILVAITTTRPLESLDVIRRQQLEASDSIPNLTVVDSFGLELAQDNIHLTSPGVVKLGYAMAEAMHSLLTPDSLLPSLPPIKIFDSTIVFIPSENTKNMIPQRVKIEDILGIYNSTRSVVNNMLIESEAFQESNTSTRRDKFPLFQSGLKAVNFVSGDINLIDFMNVLTRNVCFESSLSSYEDRVFCDLGCGSGIALAAALLTGYFNQIVGIELNKAKVKESQILLDVLMGQLASSNYNKLQSLHNKTKLKSPYKVIEGNFLDTSSSNEFNWVTSAHVIYACATCFAVDQIQKLTSLFRQLKSGTIVILLDRRVLDDMQEEVLIEASEDKELPVKRSMFSLLANCQCNTTWGYGSVFVYKKMF